jgi:beta-glucosidase
MQYKHEETASERERRLPYADSTRPARERTIDLLSRMTVEEKAWQMMCLWNGKAETLIDDEGKFDLTKARSAFRDGHAIGQVGRPSDSAGGLGARTNAELTNEIQRFFLEHTRLGIPVIFHEECLHGHAARGATSYPQPIALAASFNPALVEAVYAATAQEARARGTHQALAPVLDVARDPRWGRVEETFGEDPHLVGMMGVAAVKGLQGDATFADGKHLIATLKHFAAHGQPESGMNCAPVNVSERVLREVFLPPFRKAIQDAGAISVMASYNEIDAVPSHANTWLLRDVLRGEWGFDGYVVSDYYALEELSYRPDTHGHFVAEDGRDAAVLAIRAGVNLETPEPDRYLNLIELVRNGTLDESELDALVEPMLFWKFRLGLFDDPYVDPGEADRIVGSDENRSLALEAALASITLLKNDADLLPLDVNALKTIAVIGPNADRSLLGGYSGVPPHDVSVLVGIREAVGPGVDVRYAEGCKITVGGSWKQDEVVLSTLEDDRRQIAEAVDVAREADVVVLAIGGNEQTSRESWARTHMGDRCSVDLFGRQQALFDAIVEIGKPVVVILFNGRPLSISAVARDASAVLECWYLGQESGRAVASTLFGEANPGGKLPISFPRSAGHLPVYYNHKPSDRRGFLDGEVTPLFAFGFGLSYTSFSLENVRLSSEVMQASDTAQVRVDVSNIGPRAGSEVVQMYVRDRVSSVTRPVKELKAFERVWLLPGESATVTFDVDFESLAFYDIHMTRVVEPGLFDIMVGSSSRDEDLQSVSLRVL